MKATMPSAGDLPDEDVDVDEMSSDSEGGFPPDDAGYDTNEQESDLAEGSEDEDLISLGGDLPNGLIEYDGSSEDEEKEWGGVGDMSDDENGRKRKRRERREGEGSARKKLKSLPT